MKKVIIVAPHPDDETLGAGGAILKYKDLGFKVHWLVLTNMDKKYGFKKKEVETRREEIKKVIKSYHFDGFFDLGLRPAGLDGYPLSFLTGEISKIFSQVKPDIVILPYDHDIHSDHRIASETSYACTKIFRKNYIKKVLMMEIISETNFSRYNVAFSPNYFIDISDYLENKVKIMKNYKGELGRHPFPRSIESIKAMATIRGSQAGCKYAEAFIVLKEIW